MRCRSLILLAGFLFSLPANAQTSSGEAARRDRAAEIDLERRMFNMRALEPRAHDQDKRDAARPAPSQPGLTDEMKARIQTMRQVNAAHFTKYAQFLKQPGTGILKLFPNTNCATDTVIRVDAECTSFVPMSSDVSFRDLGYVDRNYRDLGFEGTDFVATAFFSQGTLISLGDVPIESVSLETAPFAGLAASAVDVTPAGARESSRLLASGVTKDGHLYSSRVAAQPGTTYALRVTAYKIGNELPPPSQQSSMNQLRFLSLSVDKRADIIVVFRALERDAAGGITIVWKELSRAAAPTLKFGKKELMTDFTFTP